MLNQKGVTLVELITCLTIITVLTTISAPSIMKWKGRLNLRADALDLVGLLYRAKSEAAKRNSFVVIGVEKERYFAFMDDGRGGAKRKDWFRQPGEKQIAMGKLRPGITCSSTFPNNKARFNGYSGIKAGRFVLTDKEGNQLEIIMNINGRIRVAR